MLEQACLRWRRWGIREFAVAASRASPAPTGWRGFCWSRLACDGLGGVAVSARCLHRGQARLLQVTRSLLELACLRRRRRGVSTCAAPASRASPAPTGCSVSVGAGLPAMASAGCRYVRGACIAGKPGSYRLRGLCWSRLACDGIGGVSASARCLHRGQARLLQASAGSVGAGLPAMASVGCQYVSGACIAGKPGSYRLLGLCWSWLACDGVGGVSASTRRLHRGQARLLQASAGSVGAGLPAMASVGCQYVRGACIAGKPGSYRLRGLCWSWLACDGVGGVSVNLRWLHRGQARLLQAAWGLLELACLRWRRRDVST